MLWRREGLKISWLPHYQMDILSDNSVVIFMFFVLADNISIIKYLHLFPITVWIILVFKLHNLIYNLIFRGYIDVYLRGPRILVGMYERKNFNRIHRHNIAKRALDSIRILLQLYRLTSEFFFNCIDSHQNSSSTV